MCVSACEHVNVMYADVCVQMYVHLTMIVEAGGQHDESYAISLCFIPLSQGLSLNLELGW